MKNFLYVSNDTDKHNFKQLTPDKVNHLNLIGNRFDAIIMDDEVIKDLTDEEWLEIKCARNYGGIIINYGGEPNQRIKG